MIDSVFNKIVESKAEYLKTHFVYAGDYYAVDYNVSKLNTLILKGIKKYNIRKAMLTIISMSRLSLITKEGMEDKCMDKDEERQSINDDLESLFQDLQLGSEPDYFVSTYFLPKLTEEELKLVERDDSTYTRTFLNRTDLDENEMKASVSDSKYVNTFCERETFAIENPSLNSCAFSCHSIKPALIIKRRNLM